MKLANVTSETHCDKQLSSKADQAALVVFKLVDRSLKITDASPFAPGR